MEKENKPLKKTINEYERYGDTCEVNVERIEEDVKQAVKEAYEEFMGFAENIEEEFTVNKIFKDKFGFEKK